MCGFTFKVFSRKEASLFGTIFITLCLILICRSNAAIWKSSRNEDSRIPTEWVTLFWERNSTYNNISKEELFMHAQSLVSYRVHFVAVYVINISTNTNISTRHKAPEICMLINLRSKTDIFCFTICVCLCTRF